MATTSESLYNLKYAYSELVKYRPAYERADAMYCGTVNEVYSSPKVSKLLAKFGLAAIEDFNFAHIAVDVIAHKLHVESITADEEDEHTDVDAAIEDLFEYNELEEEFPSAHRNTGKFGDYYVMVWPRIKRTPRVLDTDIGANAVNVPDSPPTDDDLVFDSEIVAVDIIFHDPMTTRLFYDAENPRMKAYAIRSWEEGEKDTLVVRANMYYADRIERWIHRGRPDYKRDPNARWEPFTKDGNPAVLENPFEEVPFWQYRTDRPYGTPDHYYAYGPQLAINKIVKSHLANLDYQSFPQRYALMDPNVDQGGIQGTDFDPNNPDDDDQWPEDEDNETQLEADPGVVWQLDGVKTVGQFASSDADNYLKPFDRYVKAMSQLTGIPFHHFDRTGERPPSGENINQVNEEINSTAEFRQTSIGNVHKKVIAFALKLLGYDVERINITWRPVQIRTDKISWETVGLKQSYGVPEDETLIETGYLPQKVAVWREEKDRIEAQRKAEELRQEQKNLAATQAANKNQSALVNKGTAAKE